MMYHRACLLSLLLPLCLASAASARAPVPGHPIGTPGDWVHTGDYPAAALREEREGVVNFAVHFDASGTPVDCIVEQSSGSPDLDEISCRLLRVRAHFKPGLDRRGRPESGVYRSRVRWVLPHKSGGVFPTPAP